MIRLASMCLTVEVALGNIYRAMAMMFLDYIESNVNIPIHDRCTCLWSSFVSLCHQNPLMFCRYHRFRHFVNLKMCFVARKEQNIKMQLIQLRQEISIC